MEVVYVGSRPAESVIEFLLEENKFRELAGGHGVGCFALPGARHAKAFYEALIEHNADIDATTTHHLAFIVFYGNRSRLVLDRVYGPNAYCTVSRLSGLSSSRDPEFEKVDFDSDLGDRFRFQPNTVDRWHYHHSMTDCARVLLDRFQITDQVEPCLLFVNPENPEQHLIVQLDPKDPVESLLSDVLTPISLEFRRLSTYWARRDRLRWRQRDVDEALAVVTGVPDQILKLTADLEKAEIDEGQKASSIESNRLKLETLRLLVTAFEGNWRDADLRLSDMQVPASFSHQIRKVHELRRRYDEFSLKLAALSTAEPAAKEKQETLLRTLDRIRHKRYAALGQIRADVSQRVRSLEWVIERAHSESNRIRHDIESARTRCESARSLLATRNEAVEAEERKAIEEMEAQLRRRGYTDDVFSPHPSAFAVVETLKRTGLIGRDRTQPSNEKDKVRILFLTSNPEVKARLDLEEEVRAVENELRAVRFRDRIRMTLGHAVRPDDLIRLLRQEEPTIVHFSGHGSPNGIVMRSESGGFVVPGESLRQVFSERNVRMIVLSSCASYPQASALKDVVHAVIGTSDELDDEAARRFSTAFYRTLGNGYSYRDAFRDGQDAVAIHQLDNVFVAHGDLGESLFAKAPNA